VSAPERISASKIFRARRDGGKSDRRQSAKRVDPRPRRCASDGREPTTDGRAREGASKRKNRDVVSSFYSTARANASFVVVVVVVVVVRAFQKKP